MPQGGLKVFSKFREIVKARHEYAQDWKKKTGRKVFGYMCTYVPEELIYATGTLPVRILGGHEPTYLSDPHISSQFCVYCRDVLAEGLRGRYKYLDGIVHAHTCLHIRQAFNSWEMHLKPGFAHYVYMPREVRRPYAEGLLTDELNLFQKYLEEWSGNKIKTADIDNAIEVYNTNRELMRRIYEYRKSEPPLVSGSEAMAMVLASQMMDKAEHNRLLEEVLAELPERKDGPQSGLRLMIVGGENDNLEFMEMVEQSGANFVIDENCAGSRYFWNRVEPGNDRIFSIARRYLDRPPCPAKDASDRIRTGHVLNLARDYNIQGAIITQVKWCEPHGFDNVPIRDMLEANNIPTYFFEFDVTVPIGQFKIRAEAFLEQLRAEDLF
jgi:benzoyl-CoA reductase subunit C